MTVMPMALVGRKHKALHSTTVPIPEIDDKILQLSLRMVETCLVQRGLGLAAPQVGVSLRMFVTYDGLIIINPEIAYDDDDEEDFESCLSLPGQHFMVRRPKAATLHFLDKNNEKRAWEAEGFNARFITHEMDHLNGILISDRGTPTLMPENPLPL